MVVNHSDGEGLADEACAVQSVAGPRIRLSRGEAVAAAGHPDVGEMQDGHGLLPREQRHDLVAVEVDVTESEAGEVPERPLPPRAECPSSFRSSF